MVLISWNSLRGVMDYPKYWKCVLHIISHISFIHAAWAPKARRSTLKMQTLDDPPHFKIWPYLISFSFLFLKIFPRCYIPIFDGLVSIFYIYEHTVPTYQDVRELNQEVAQVLCCWLDVHPDGWRGPRGRSWPRLCKHSSNQSHHDESMPWWWM